MTEEASFIEKLGLNEKDEQSIAIMAGSAFLGAMIGGMLTSSANPAEQKINEDGLRILGLCVGFCIASSLGKPTPIKDIFLSGKIAEDGYKVAKFAMRRYRQPQEHQHQL